MDAINRPVHHWRQLVRTPIGLRGARWYSDADPSMAFVMTAVEQAQLAGFDMSLVEESLRCSYQQRALQHQAALELALELAAIGQRLRDRAQQTVPAPVRR